MNLIRMARARALTVGPTNAGATDFLYSDLSASVSCEFSPPPTQAVRSLPLLTTVGRETPPRFPKAWATATSRKASAQVLGSKRPNRTNTLPTVGSVGVSGVCLSYIIKFPNLSLQFPIRCQRSMIYRTSYWRRFSGWWFATPPGLGGPRISTNISGTRSRSCLFVTASIA